MRYPQYPSLFRRLAIRGQVGSILWRHHVSPAATLNGWSIVRRGDNKDLPPYTWHLRARCARADAFLCRQKPLLFTAPHARGMWCWGVESVELVGLELRARLGPPEQ